MVERRHREGTDGRGERKGWKRKARQQGRKTCLSVAHAVFFRFKFHRRQKFLGGCLGIIFQVFGYLGTEDVVSTARSAKRRSRGKKERKKKKKGGARLVLQYQKK